VKARMTVEEAREQQGSAVMPAWVLHTPELGASAKFVYLMVENCPGETIEFYSEWQDITPEAVKSGLNTLWKLGVIRVDDQKRPWPKPPEVGITEE
jgi:hypothetical protein